jgi:hypothetical protein
MRWTSGQLGSQLVLSGRQRQIRARKHRAYQQQELRGMAELLSDPILATAVPGSSVALIVHNKISQQAHRLGWVAW